MISPSRSAALFLDCDNRIIGWRMGIVGGKANEARWDDQNAELSSALEKLARKLPCQAGTPSGVARGEHTWAHWGYSYGGGERVRSAGLRCKHQR